MTKAEAGSIGGKVTVARYGTETITCPLDGCICEKRTCFTANRAAKAGRKGIKVLQAKYSKEQRREWSRKGGRPRKS